MPRSLTKPPLSSGPLPLHVMESTTLEDALCDRGDDLDASVEEAEAVKVGAQVVGRAGDHKGDALLGEFVNEVAHSHRAAVRHKHTEL